MMPPPLPPRVHQQVGVLTGSQSLIDCLSDKRFSLQLDDAGIEPVVCASVQQAAELGSAPVLVTSEYTYGACVLAMNKHRLVVLLGDKPVDAPSNLRGFPVPTSSNALLELLSYCSIHACLASTSQMLAVRRKT